MNTRSQGQDLRYGSSLRVDVIAIYVLFMKTLWFDITNTPHVHFLAPIIERYRSTNRILVTVRDYSESADLARRKFNELPILIGRHGGTNKMMKLKALVKRLHSLSNKINCFDFALSCGGFEACFVAKLQRRVSIAFDDNDISPNWMYSHFTDHAFFPEAVSVGTLLNQGFKPQSIHQYDGYKEDIYIADYEPDVSFLNRLPFSDYVVVRPENYMANYVSNKESIAPQLLRILSEGGYNVLYLPRTDSQRRYAYGLSNIYIPRRPINGLDACHFSRAVISGAGSLTREAACLGKPAVSFFAGLRLLAVDERMIQDGWLLHSRTPEVIVEYIGSANSRKFDRQRSKEVQSSLFGKLDEILLN